MVVASVGTFSGPAGATLALPLQGVRLWVKAVNARGGINGHHVDLVVYDDGADPARYRAGVQDAVEKRGAIAFLNNTGAITGHSSVDYIERQRVAVIGSEGGTPGFYTSPMFFPGGSHFDALFESWIGSLAGQVLPLGKTKVALVFCAEAQACSDADRVFSQKIAAAGFAVVYRAKASIVQPDYTAECLAARNAGAEVMFAVMDSNSYQRIGTSCARQGFRPTFGTGASVVADRFKDDPNLDGLVASTNVFPYFQSGSPATDEFQSALRQYGRGLINGVGAATGWTSGKMFERAARNLPEPPTREAVLDGLWTFKTETLGGLTEPLTFLRDQPAKPLACWFDLAIKNKSWVSPDNFKLHCLD